MTGKKGPPTSFQTNDRIFAKVKGYPAWPACVTGPNDAKGTRYKVYFYGTYETAVVKREEMWLFNEKTKEKFGKQKRKGFAEAVDEIENRPEVGYLTEELLPVVNEALEGGTSGDTILEDPELDASTVEESKEPVVTKTEEPVAAPKVAEPKVAEPKVAAPSPTPGPAPLTKSTVTQSAKKGAKRKAPSDEGEDSPALTPVAKQAKINTSTPVAAKQPKTKIKTETSTPVAKPIKATISTPIVAPSPPPPTTPVASAANEEKISRSGRVIKPKKFEDEKDSENQKNAMMRWMKMEKRIVDLDIAIRSALHHEEPDMARSLVLISELHSLAIQPLMLKKLPNIVMTLRKVRKYIGPKTQPQDPKMNEKRQEDMQKIRLTAETAYKKIQSLFNAPPDVSFSKYFQKMVDEFQIATKDYEKEELFQLLVDPTIVA